MDLPVKGKLDRHLNIAVWTKPLTFDEFFPVSCKMQCYSVQVFYQPVRLVVDNALLWFFFIITIYYLLRKLIFLFSYLILLLTFVLCKNKEQIHHFQPTELNNSIQLLPKLKSQRKRDSVAQTLFIHYICGLNL